MVIGLHIQTFLSNREKYRSRAALGSAPIGIYKRVLKSISTICKFDTSGDLIITCFFSYIKTFPFN